MSISVCKVWFDSNNILVQLKDKRIIAAPIELYPRLKNATPQQRNEFELWDDGRWIHWEQLDEDLSAQGFLQFEKKQVV